jgi:MFS family permease
VFAAQACATAQAAASGGAARSSAVGLYLTCYYVGGGIGAVVLAPLFSSAGWPACVGLLGAVAVLGAVAALVSWPARAGAAPPDRAGRAASRRGRGVGPERLRR